MQFSISAVLVAAMAILRVQAGAVVKRVQDASVDQFASPGCVNFVRTGNSLNEHGQGGCFQFSEPSIRVASLLSPCTVTVYTDGSCSSGATAARLGQCVTAPFGNWGSVSTDNCT